MIVCEEGNVREMGKRCTWVMLEGLRSVGGFDGVCGCVWVEAEDFVRVDVGWWLVADIFRIGCHDCCVADLVWSWGGIKIYVVM